MSDPPKRMCKWNKSSIRKFFPEFCKTVKSPEYVCMKCGRVAAKRKCCCNPEALKEG